MTTLTRLLAFSCCALWLAEVRAEDAPHLGNAPSIDRRVPTRAELRIRARDENIGAAVGFALGSTLVSASVGTFVGSGLCGLGDTTASRERCFDSFERPAIALGVLGGASIVSGVVLAVLAGRDTGLARLLPALSSDGRAGGSIGLSGRF